MSPASDRPVREDGLPGPDAATDGAPSEGGAASRTPHSMTGFARVDGGCDGFRWTWEARSVNGRGRELRTHIPGGYGALEPRARALAEARFARGALSLRLALDRDEERRPSVRVNRAVLDRLIEAHDALRDRIEAPPARLETLMALPGVIETAAWEDDAAVRDRRRAAIEASLADALDALAGSRREEGARMARLIDGHLDEIAALCRRAAARAAGAPEALRARLQRQLAELLGADPPLAEGRLAQEIAYLASRSDVREEIGRIDAHTEAARALLAAGGAIGRKLGFLAQELNREANTLCAKSTDLALTRIGLDLKAEVDRLREQALNLE